VGNGCYRLPESVAGRVVHGSPSTSRCVDLNDAHAASDRQFSAIPTIDNTVGSLGEAADNFNVLRTRFACPTIVVIAETDNPVDIQQIASLAPNVYIATLTSRELLLSALARLVLVPPSAATTASPSERLARLDPLECPGSNNQSPTSTLGNVRDGKEPLFSQRERQILGELARGSSNKEIARLFSITESTVKVHLKALLRKIGARNRTQAAIWAVSREHLVPWFRMQSVSHSLHPTATNQRNTVAM
jgi:two-component system, NarL family, nitrate/nitrite response regulator NarL